jgi:hypothetical protein
MKERGGRVERRGKKLMNTKKKKGEGRKGEGDNKPTPEGLNILSFQEKLYS